MGIPENFLRIGWTDAERDRVSAIGAAERRRCFRGGESPRAKGNRQV
jgi:hypothetical protein